MNEESVLEAEELPFTKEQLLDQWWRLCHLYTYTEKAGGPRKPFVPNDEQKSMFDRWWPCIVNLKARQIGSCLVPSTRVLKADLTWVPISEIRTGDRLVAVDEHAPKQRGSCRKMRTAEVQGYQSLQRMTYRITFDDGRDVVCTGLHPWLARTKEGMGQWRRIEEKGRMTGLKPGVQVRWVTKPWGESSVEDGWFGGMLDGEGSLAKRSRSGASVVVSQREGAVWDRLVAYAKGRGYNFRTEADAAERPSKFGKTPVPKVVFSRMDEMFRLIGQTRPTRFIGREWWEGKALPGKGVSDVGWATIVSVEPVGVQEVVDLQTSTGTYIAEGFVSHNTTFLILVALDLCLFSDNFRAGIIAQGWTEGIALFKDKVRDVYDALPRAIRGAVTLVTENKTELQFSNGSGIRIGVSMRGGTLQYLLITEFGKVAAKNPALAREIITGAMNTVAVGQQIIVESTSEGAGGAFFDLVQTARALAQKQTPLTALDFRFNFYPWWRRPEYSIDPAGVLLSPNDVRYFEKIENTVTTAPGEYIVLTAGQKAWYVKKAETQKGDMKREFPSTPDESFEVAVEGAFYSKELELVRKRGQVGDFPWIPHIPVSTFWDLGGSLGNATSIWFHQIVNGRDRMIGFYEAEGEGMAHFAKYLQDTGYLFAKHWLPHDGGAKLQGDYRESRQEILERLAIRNIEIVDRVKDIGTGIELTRAALVLTDFNEEECTQGLAALAAYTKSWNQARGVWNEEPFHNWASNPADAFRGYGQAYQLLRRNGPQTSAVKNHALDIYEVEVKRRNKAARRDWKSI